MIPTGPRYREVIRELTRGFNPFARRRYAVDPESPRNRQHAMCSLCTWQREFHDGRKACDAALSHGQKSHGDAMVAFVRVECV